MKIALCLVHFMPTFTLQPQAPSVMSVLVFIMTCCVRVCRDINAGRYNNGTSLVLVTHGLALRVFLMRWFHWTVDQFLEVFNPPNAEV